MTHRRRQHAAVARRPIHVVAAGIAVVGMFLGAPAVSWAADRPEARDAADETARRQKHFRDLVTDVTLVGRFTIDRPPAPAAPLQPDGEAQPRKDAGAGDAADLALREEEYAITGAVPLGGDLWALTARIRYGETDVTIPVPIAVKWAGDTPVLTLDRITLPGLGTFSSRVVLDGDRYAGTWQHDDVGGHMFGRIERRATSTGQVSPRPADR